MGVIWVIEKPAVRTSRADYRYTDGDYAHARRCFDAANVWAKESGAAMLPGLEMFVLPPHHAESPWNEKEAPEELLDDPHWVVVVHFHCDDDGLRWLLAQPLPEDVRFLLLGSWPGRSSEADRLKPAKVLLRVEDVQPGFLCVSILSWKPNVWIPLDRKTFLADVASTPVGSFIKARACIDAEMPADLDLGDFAPSPGPLDESKIVMGSDY